MNFIIYFLSINIITFFICFIDKRNARKGKWRVSEKSLLVLSILGGCFGMIIGMRLFHHKTKKIKFKLVYLFCIMWLFLLFWNFKMS